MTMFEDLGVDAISALGDINGEFDKSKATMESINEIKYDDFGSAIEGIKRQLDTNILIPLGESLLPILEDVAKWIAENLSNMDFSFIENLNVSLGSMSDTLTNLLPLLVGVASAFTSFKVITTVQSAITTFTSALTAAGGASALFASVMATLTAPIALVVGAIGGLTAALVYLYQNNETVRASLDECWERIKEMFSSVCDAIMAIVDAFVDAFNTLWDKYGESITEVAIEVWELIVKVFETAIELITDIFNVFSKAFQGDWKGCWEAVKDLVSDAWDNICSLIGEFLDLVITSIVNWGLSLFTAGQSAFEALKQGIGEVWDSITEWFEGAIKDPIGTIESIGSDLYNAGVEIFTSLWDGIKSVWDGISSWVEDKVNWIADKVTFWNNSQDSMDGSHRTGLNEVPFDGYKAILHKGEMVLTQAEANRYRKNQQTQQIITQTLDTSNLESKIDKVIQAVVNIPRLQKINANMA